MVRSIPNPVVEAQMVAFFSIAARNEDGTSNSQNGAVLAVGFQFFAQGPSSIAKQWCEDNGYNFNSRISRRSAANLGVEDPSSIALSAGEAQVVASNIVMWVSLH